MYEFQYCRYACDEECKKSVEQRTGQEELRSGANTKWQSSWSGSYRDQKDVQAHLDRIDRPLGIFDQFFFWTCPENCKYTCMHTQEQARRSAGQDPVKYYGKWPFIKVFGIQELFSVLFSLTNMLPFLYHFFHWNQWCPDGYFMKRPWFWYTVSGINTWFWSAVFHARDTPQTERLDYFFATFSILFLVYQTVLRQAKLVTLRNQLYAAFPFLLYFVWHCASMHWKLFDYGWNMAMMVLFASTYILAWFVWAIRHYKEFPHVKLLLIANMCIVVLSAFELLDFPPYMQQIDAHAIWHCFTPIVTVLTFKFAQKDAISFANETMRKFM